jgi:hypothetical protein
MPKKKGQKDKQWCTKNCTEKKDWATRTSVKKKKRGGMDSGAPEEWAVSAPLVAPIMFHSLQTQWAIINEEKTGLSMIICDTYIL